MLTPLKERLPHEILAVWSAAKRLAGGAIALVSFLLAAPSAQAFDPATDHTCVAYCGGGSAPSSGGGYVAPAPRGPSPAELARRRAHAAGIAANNRGAAAIRRKLTGGDISSRMREMLGNYKEAIKDFEEAARYLPNDANVHLNLANARGMVAQFEGRYADAVRYFEQALRYSPNNATVKENLRRAQVSLRNVPKMKKEDSILAAARDAEAANDWIANERYLRAAYKACTGYGCEAFIPRIHRAIGRQALIQKNWDAAIRELKQSKAWYVDQERKYGKAYGISYPDDIREMQKLIDVALAGKAHEEEAKKAEAQHKADEQRREQASNPNYPKPPPVYRNAKTPRDYPDLGYYTPAQHKAHDDNVMGNVWSKTGNWVNALLSYQRALDEDPDGPFSKVIKENLDIAMTHLGPQKPKTVPTSAAAAPAVPSPTPPQEKPKEIVQSNCTGWMTANGKTSRLCMDEQAHRYCEEQSGNSVSRVSCQ